MPGYTQSFHKRLDELLGATTKAFLDKLHAVYAAGNVRQVLGVKLNKIVETKSNDTVVPKASAATHSTSKRLTIATYLKDLRQRFITGKSLFTTQATQSAQTA